MGKLKLAIVGALVAAVTGGLAAPARAWNQESYDTCIKGSGLVGKERWCCERAGGDWDPAIGGCYKGDWKKKEGEKLDTPPPTPTPGPTSGTSGGTSGTAAK